MKRLTTDTPEGNFETMLNFVFGKDGWAYIRDGGEGYEVPLHEWAKAQCLRRGCDEFSAETPEEIDREICDCMMDFPDCPIALAYCFASQAVHMRSRLKRYEDTGLTPEQITDLQQTLDMYGGEEGLTAMLGQLEILRKKLPNDPLTLEELREMGGEPVWTESHIFPEDCGWRVIRKAGIISVEFTDGRHFSLTDYDKSWLAYRRKPEEAVP